MKKLKLSLGKQNQLTKEQMKKINGGGGDCIVYQQGHRDEGESFHTPSGITCAQSSEVANQMCVWVIQNWNWENCHYDCDCDGWGV